MIRSFWMNKYYSYTCNYAIGQTDLISGQVARKCKDALKAIFLERQLMTSS